MKIVCPSCNWSSRVVVKKNGDARCLHCGYEFKIEKGAK